ncbi:hypothetical protein L0337_43500 [candidate division KSB1 bacterium]|nr:hypothetical protein [candidate division KSB1 bacterium]
MKIYQDCLTFSLTLLLSILTTCTSKSRHQPPDAKDFTVIFGSGGGFTGMANGYIIHGNGKVEKWSGQYFRRGKVETMGAVVASETLQPLKEMFDTGAFTQWSYQETGNMTTRVWCISGQDTAVVSWNGIEPGEKVPQPIRDFYANLMKIVESVR